MVEENNEVLREMFKGKSRRYKRIYVNPELHSYLNSERTKYGFPSIGMFLEASFKVHSEKLKKTIEMVEKGKSYREKREEVEALRKEIAIKREQRENAKLEREKEKLRRELEAWKNQDKKLFNKSLDKKDELAMFDELMEEDN